MQIAYWLIFKNVVLGLEEGAAESQAAIPPSTSQKASPAYDPNNQLQNAHISDCTDSTITVDYLEQLTAHHEMPKFPGRAFLRILSGINSTRSIGR